MRTPLISVLIASFNYARYLPSAIDSVLAQTCSDFEMIIVDDGSIDGSVDIIQRYAAKYPEKIRIFFHPQRQHAGIIKTYQRALNEAKGEYVAFLEADDVWQPENLAVKADILNRFPDVNTVYSTYQPFGDRLGRLFWSFHSAINKITTQKNRPMDAYPSFLMRNSVASFSHFMTRRRDMSVIPFPKMMPKYLDWWFLAHLSLKGRFYFIPEKLCNWRIHPRSANSVRMTRRTVFRIFHFLSGVYASLEKELEARTEPCSFPRYKLERHLSFQGIVRRRKRILFYRKLFLHPIETARFLGFVFLHRCCFGEQRLVLGVGQ